MQAVFLTFPLLLHSYPPLISPYGLHVWVTARSVRGPSHISLISPPSPSLLQCEMKHNLHLKMSVFKSYWRPLIMKTIIIWKPASFTRNIWRCNVNAYCLINIARTWVDDGFSFNYHVNEKARCSHWHLSNDHVCWIIYIHILHDVTYCRFKLGCESWTERRSRSCI